MMRSSYSTRSKGSRQARLALGLLLALGALQSTAFPGGASAQTISAELSATGLEITGATLGGEIAILGAWRQRHVYWSEVGSVDERIVDDDGDGTVSWESGRAIPMAAVLVVIDLASGQWTGVAPEGFGLRSFPKQEWQVATDGSLVSVLSKRLELSWVRPGSWVWSRVVMDGGTLDDPLSPTGSLSVSTAEIAPGEGGGVPDGSRTFSSGDLVVGIDLQTLEYFVYEVSGGAA